MVDKLIDAPLQKKCLCYFSISCKDCWFLPIEFSLCGLGSNGVGVIVRVVSPSASSTATSSTAASSTTASSTASSANKARGLEESTRRSFWFIQDGLAGIGEVSFSTGGDVSCFRFRCLGLSLGLSLRGHNQGESRKGSVGEGCDEGCESFELLFVTTTTDVA